MHALLAAALFARITTLAPREQMQPAFEAGYRRHLQWHRSHRDPWTWHGWTVISGDRLGTFIDATFGHDASAFDNAVAPAEDAADNAGNVLPFASLTGSSFYRARPDLCAAAPEQVAARFATLLTLRANDRSRAEMTIREAHLTAFCHELAAGGRAGTYLVFIPAATVADALLSPPLPLDPFEAVTIETLRYRTDLTYAPEP